jgi:hypothetical protein
MEEIMKNTDTVTYIGYTVGGKSGKNTLGAKVRFITDSKNASLRMKELDKMGMTEVFFTPLPAPMTKAEAVQWMSKNVQVTRPEIQAVIDQAISRLVPSN